MSGNRASEETGLRAILLTLLLSVLISPAYIFLAAAFDGGEMSFIVCFLAPLLGWTLVASWRTRHSRDDEDGVYMLSRLAVIWAALPIMMNLLAIFFQELERESVAHFFLRIKFWSLLIGLGLAGVFSVAKDWWEEVRSE
ncbi:MAG: hypothetical protein QG642_694 [Patescibacteria group bacterium]|nr:hypothetical protein [Patescibacteria group bacterium]